MEIGTLFPGDSGYSAGLAALPNPPKLSFIGNMEILQKPLLAVFASVKCPASLILKAHDTAQELSTSGQAVISGFQSPAEKEVLTVLLRGNSPIVICPARGLEGIRIPLEWRRAFEDERLLLLSPFPTSIKRGTAAISNQRNLMVALISSEILIVHAEPGSKIGNLRIKMQASQKTIRYLSVGNKAFL